MWRFEWGILREKSFEIPRSPWRTSDSAPVSCSSWKWPEGGIDWGLQHCYFFFSHCYLRTKVCKTFSRWYREVITSLDVKFMIKLTSKDAFFSTSLKPSPAAPCSTFSAASTAFWRFRWIWLQKRDLLSGIVLKVEYGLFQISYVCFSHIYLLKMTWKSSWCANQVSSWPSKPTWWFGSWTFWGPLCVFGHNLLCGFFHNSPLSDCLSASLWHGSLFHPKKGNIIIFCCIIKNLPDSHPDLSLFPIPSFPSACDQIYCHRSPISFLKDKILLKPAWMTWMEMNMELPCWPHLWDWGSIFVAFEAQPEKQKPCLGK